MEKKPKHLPDIALASKHVWATSEAELLTFLELDAESTSEEILIATLIQIADNPQLQLLDADTRLAVIKSAQELLGRIFLQALADVKSEQ